MAFAEFQLYLSLVYSLLYVFFFAFPYVVSLFTGPSCSL